MSNLKEMFVEREMFVTKEGKKFWSYHLKGTVRGRDVRVDLIPKDKGGYEPLDIVFDVSPQARLVISEEEMTGENGKTMKYTTYKVVTVDEDGVIYECGVKPSKDSDKTLLKMLLNSMSVSK